MSEIKGISSSDTQPVVLKMAQIISEDYQPGQEVDMFGVLEKATDGDEVLFADGLELLTSYQTQLSTHGFIIVDGSTAILKETINQEKLDKFKTELSPNPFGQLD